MQTTYQMSIGAARAALAAAGTAPQSEISAYPTPIAGCDVQFNQLLADRQKVTEALRALEGTVFIPTPRTPTEHAGIKSR